MFAEQVLTAEDIGRKVPDLHGVYFGKFRVAGRIEFEQAMIGLIELTMDEFS